MVRVSARYVRFSRTKVSGNRRRERRIRVRVSEACHSANSPSDRVRVSEACHSANSPRVRVRVRVREACYSANSARVRVREACCGANSPRAVSALFATNVGGFRILQYFISGGTPIKQPQSTVRK